MKPIFLSLLFPLSIHAQVTLQPWVEVFGTTNGQQLGKYVTGITPSANLPYKAAISQVGSTGVYRLNLPSDTSVQQVFLGENMLTGDLNSDGFIDVVVGKSVNGYDTTFIYWGTTTGIDTLDPFRIPGESQQFLGALRPACIRDINNDGLSDLILSDGNYRQSRGKVYIFLQPITSAITPDTVTGDTVDAGIGWSVSIGDIDCDGFGDLIIRGKNQTGPPGPQRYDYINIYWGVGIDTLNLTLGLQMRTNVSVEPGLACFDANGDGRDDLLWTALLDSVGVRIFLHYGRTQFDTIPDIRLRNPGVGTFGFVLANAGDMNGDGFNDVIVGCPQATTAMGTVIVYGGGPRIDAFADGAVTRGNDADFGRTVAGLGDVTGDGLADIMAGGPFHPWFENRGRWGIFMGDTNIHVTSVQETMELPGEFSLGNAYPNPFNPLATIPFEVKGTAWVTITIVDELGRIVKTLVQGEKQPGTYKTEFDGSSYATGVYYYRMEAITRRGTRSAQTKKVLLIR